MFNVQTHSAIIITCLYQICLLKVSPVGSFKHLPDGHGTQITAYFCAQLASKSSSLISYIVHVSYQPISVYFWMVEMYKIQRENILQRPICLYCCPDCPSCKAHLNSISLTTWAIWITKKKYSLISHC